MKENKFEKLKILFISSSDLHGGANIAGYNLHCALLKEGHISSMVVDRKLSNNTTVYEAHGFFKKYIKRCIAGKRGLFYSYRIGKILQNLYGIFYKILKNSGREIFFYPASRNFLSKINYNPDIIHLHNIYADYFDINLLKKWHEKYKLVITFHDFWILTGHCGLPLNCDRWLEGCQICPHLDYAPSITKDKARQNKEFKNRFFNNLKINYISPSKWVFNKIQKSNNLFLKDGTHTMIKNSVDVEMFKPGDKYKVRRELNLPISNFIIMVCSAGFKNNYCKDLDSVITAFDQVKQEFINTKNITLLIVGERSENYPQFKNKDILFSGSILHGENLAAFYQASDIFIHSSSIETWGLTTSEALSTGLPVIAAYVPGLKEQVKGYCIDSENDKLIGMNSYLIAEATGLMFEKGNANMLSKCIRFLYENKKIYNSLSTNARTYAENDLSTNLRIKEYLNYYSRLIE